ncbi:winged helix-turn-helix domain-containing protein [Jiangella sp. DSM 45060]|uniref:winged helix-turn-helix domain-containing protein n=1 Tax=Jiangella sp. DSM 45060 TaxID=1798224 RepID=UPI00087A8214|nr:winged helix-turn-helix domain-containing protein [Jiangella sp. DSM 45060]SDS65640.1 DNA-binding transcriptional regulator, ArsR family [Jiangella sp. DSM 45060]
MPSDQPQKVTDPQSMRALAHPLRLQLMDLLGIEPELTATECAERTGESVASCSFHLRMLAKYGYVELGEPRGREKPWRLVSRNRTVGPDVENPESVREASAFARIVVEREADRLLRTIGRAAELGPGWDQSMVINTSSFWLTRDELTEVMDRLGAFTDDIVARYGHRREDPASRPDDARVVHFLGALSPDPDLDTHSTADHEQ